MEKATTNGTALNGTAINGTAINGTAMNGTAMNGTAMNGTAMNGTVDTWQERHTEGEQFLTKIVPVLLEKLRQTYGSTEGKVVEFTQPEELYKKIDLALSDEPVTNDRLEKLLEQTIHYSVKTGHAHFFNQVFAGMDNFALGGALLTEALNCSGYTYEVAPVCTLMEKQLIQHIAKVNVGYPQGDGIFCPGGSAANMYGFSLARFKRFPESKTKGMQGIPPVHIYTSKLGHYSWSKGAFFMGLGLDNIILVETDAVGRMIPEELDRVIQESKDKGFVPLMVNATAGTTVMGAYDPIEKIHAVCKKHGADGHIWLHVDGAWGGSVILSDKLKYKMKGVELSDSVIWDPHKMTGSIQQCAVVVTRHPGLLAKAHCAKARYLFQQDKAYDVSYDTGDMSLQCGRKVDALKLWVQWKAYGNDGMAQRVETCFENALYLRDMVRDLPGFRLLIEEPDCTNVCFWYIPENLRAQKETPEWWDKLSKVAPAIKKRMQEQGSMLVGYQPQGDHVNFWRMIVAGANSTRADMDYVIHIISSYGELLFKK